MKKQEQENVNKGTVVFVRGSVVDACFSQKLPAIYNKLCAGKKGEIVIEVLMHLNPEMVRGIALTPTRELSRGSFVIDTEQPICVPVGRQLLGRAFNVFGETIDNGDALKDVEWRSIHQPPVPLAKRAVTSEIFTTGIKAIDVLVPLERGGKAGLFGGAGGRKNRSHYRNYP